MHLGHARTYCFWDTFRRYLEYRGYHVYLVMNFTDVDDRIIGAAGPGRGWLQVAEEMAARFKVDSRALHIRDCSAYTRATDFVAATIETISRIIERGHAYVVDGEVLYDTAKFERYGQLSGNTLSELEAGASGRLSEEARRKRHPADFTLWKPSKPGEPCWQTGHSDWPSGRPGWHIECTVMACSMLGEHLDMHGGAVDNMFPHHENELAQSEVLYPAPWCNTWMHPEHLDLRNPDTDEEVKMSKSIGNVISVPQALEGASANDVRWFFTSTHYRTKLSFSWTLLDASRQGFSKVQKLVSILAERLDAAPEGARAIPVHGTYATERAGDLAFPRDRELMLYGAFKDHNQALIDRFMEAMDDDLNAPQAAAAIFDYVRDVYRSGIEQHEDLASVAAVYRCLTRHLYVLGVEYPSSSLYPELAVECFAQPAEAGDSRMGEVIDKLLLSRQQARQAKDYAKADLIRTILEDSGLEIEDTPQGARWSLKN